MLPINLSQNLLTVTLKTAQKKLNFQHFFETATGANDIFEFFKSQKLRETTQFFL